jgi:hypothetical protein
MTEALRLAFFDRATYLGDPAFVSMPLNRLLSKDYAARLRGQISNQATASASLGPAVAAPGEKPETTHYSVLDSAGNAVSVTTTINGAFGAGVVAGGAGFLLNDEMDDFTIKAAAPNQFGLVQGEGNVIAPGKRPLSSMAPAVVLKDGAVELVAGSPGGPRIITATMEAILNVIGRAAAAPSMGAGRAVRRTLRAVAGHQGAARAHGIPDRGATALGCGGADRIRGRGNGRSGGGTACPEGHLPRRQRPPPPVRGGTGAVARTGDTAASQTYARSGF